MGSVLLSGFANGQTPLKSRITTAIDESNTVTINGNVHPAAAATSLSEAADEGTPMQHMILFLKGDASQETQLEQLIAAQNNPKSPAYHQYLTPKDYAAQFGVAQSDLAIVANWLQDHGFQVEETPAGNRTIIFSGTAAQVASAFKTEIRKYSVKGEVHYANASDPQIPAALAGTVGGIVKLHDFRHGHSLTGAKPVDAAELAHAQFTSGSSHYLAPADYRTIYDINPLYSAGINGTGQTIAVLARSDINLTDVEAFRSNFGLTANNPVFVHTNSAPGVLQGDSTETTLDTEWSGAVAPNATIKVIISDSTNTSDGIDLAALYAVNNNVAPIITLSYGSCEAGMGSTELAFYNNLWKQAAAQGQTVMVSAGDSGAAGCDYGSTAVYGQAVNGLCSSPYATCVGGTELAEGSNPGQYWLPGNNTTYGSAVSYIPEMVWNESGTVSGGSDLWAGGGGASIIYTKPAWQTGAGVPADGMRDVPDVSLTAAGSHDGYLIWLGGALNSVGGTSAAAPSFAGMMALVTQKTAARQGAINPVLYPLAAKQAAGGAAVFHDTTAGNNSVPGQAGFSATTGYDRASGLGSVDASVMANHWTDGAVTPSITLTGSASSVTVIAGKTGMATITSAAVSINAAVAFTVTGMPAGLTATFASASIASPGSGTDVLNFSAAATVVAGTYPLSVKATSGAQTATLSISVVVPTPSFTMSPATSSVAVAAGSSAPVTVSAAPVNGFSSILTLSVSGLPAGVTTIFSPSTISGTLGGSSIITFVAASSATAGTYAVHVTATGGGLTQMVSVNVTVTGPASFTLASSAASVGIATGGSAHLTISETPVNGFMSPVALTIAGVPAGVNAVFSPAAFSGASGGSSTLTLTANNAAKMGPSTITVTATSGSLSKTASFSLAVTVQPLCSLAVNPVSVPVAAGQSASAVVSCAVTQGIFTSPVALSLSGAPAGMTATAASSLTPGSTAALSIATAASMAAGHYGLTLTASGSGYSQSTTVGVAVSAPNTFTLTGGASALTLNTGSTAQVSATTLHSGAFNSALAFSATGLPSGVTAAFSKSAIAAPGDGASNVIFTAASSAKSGSYTVIITAAGGGVTKTVPVSLTVAAGPGFTLALNTNSITVAQGATGSIISSTGNYTGGFNGQLTVAFSGIPTGVNYAVTGATAANNLVNITFGFSVPSKLAAGTYPITIKDTGTGVSQSATFNLIVTK